MSFSRVPEDFMKGTFLSPHSFSDPENPAHGEYVNLQLRNDLYFSALNSISNVEFGIIGSDEEWIQVTKIKACSGKLPWYNEYIKQYKQKKGKSLSNNQNHKLQMISCEDWEIAYHRGENVRKSEYRVENYQTDTDIFKSEITPSSFFKSLKDLLMN